MLHSICAVSPRAPGTRRVPHEERLILQVAHHAVLLDQTLTNWNQIINWLRPLDESMREDVRQ
jgi:hypothetical protein